MENVDDVIRMLDNMAEGGVSRIKVEISEEVADGSVKKAYHHGRCDVGSPQKRLLQIAGKCSITRTDRSVIE